MMQPEKEQRHAPGEAAPDGVCGKTARACDGCVRHRARWYCGADDAFLCQGCDASVHSANPLARRHQRVRLKTASSSSSPPPPAPTSCGVVLQAVKPEKAPVLAWLKGFRRKARSRRSQGQAKAATGSAQSSQAPTAVPDLVETSVDENEEEEERALLYRVPIFDPVLSEFCSVPAPLVDDANASPACDAKSSVTAEQSDCAPTTSASSAGDAADRQLSSFLPTDVELAEFAANMESLLSGAVDDGDDSFCMEKFGLLDPMDHDGGSCLGGAEPVKAEQHPDMYSDDNSHVEQSNVDASTETTELSFDLGHAINGDDAEEEKTAHIAAEADAAVQGGARTAKLRLDYEAIMAAWACHGSSPWTDGKRPQVSTDGCWTDCMGLWVHGGVQMPGAGGEGGVAAHGDVGREARVTRYREKRRMRLFSKKIRYEVRKLNAEKRPRIKGRFVKRAPGVALGIAH